MTATWTSPARFDESREQARISASTRSGQVAVAVKVDDYDQDHLNVNVMIWRDGWIKRDPRGAAAQTDQT